MRSPHRSILVSAAIAMAIAMTAPAAATAVDDPTPPVPTSAKPVEFQDFHRATGSVELKLSFADPESGLASALVSCDGGPEASYPYSTRLLVPGLDPSAGGCAGYGQRWMQVRVVNGAGGIAGPYGLEVGVYPTFTLQYPSEARTGHPFTVHPQYSPGFVQEPTDICRWEVRWGSIRSLRDNDFDETFGGMMFEGPASEGYCGDWTFTLPWVPEPRFEFNFDNPGAGDVRSSQWPDRNLVLATVDGTDRRIRSSTLPIVQVLPNTYTPIAGLPITYTRYLIGGATVTAADRPVWTARLGSGETPIVWEKWTTASTFTITPPTTGDMFVGWNTSSGFLLGAYYDPPVRHRDTTRPNTTAPVQRITSGDLGAGAPVELTWTASDVGWGIASYRLQQSVDGAAWATVYATTKARIVVRHLSTGHTYRFRVRATDKAGNIGDWDYGPTFRPTIIQETSAGVIQTGLWTNVADVTALGMALDETTAAGASARLSFFGRDVAWAAERGPGHGLAKVYIDGSYVATVDLNATADSPRRVVFRRHWATAGTHLIRLVALGTSGRPIVDVDAFLVLR